VVENSGAMLFTKKKKSEWRGEPQVL